MSSLAISSLPYFYPIRSQITNASAPMMCIIKISTKFKVRLTLHKEMFLLETCMIFSEPAENRNMFMNLLCLY